MSNLSLKFMLNRDKTKVLFAEAGGDFIDVLLSFLALPLGKAVAILREHFGDEQAPAVGSLNTLRKGVADLDVAHFRVRGAKEMLLNPGSSFRAECRKLAIDVTAAAPRKYFLCSDVECSKYAYVNISTYSDVAKCECGKMLSREIRVGECLADGDGDGDGGAFVISPLFFVVADDLRVAPIVTGIVQVLKDFGITETQGAEMRSLSLGVNEIFELLKLSLTSASPLTDFINKNTHTISTEATPQPAIRVNHTQKQDADESRKMVLKVCSQKSTNKFLFAEATDEFVELLLSFLTVPLGGVESLLSGNTGLKNIDNLYRSVSDFINDEYFTSPDVRNRLMNPKLAHAYVSKNQFLLPLCEEGPPKLHYQLGEWLNYSKRYEYTFHEKEGTLVSSFKSSKEGYVKKQTMFFVADDLTMNPSLASSILILNDLGVPLSDVKETEVHIGLDEALGILKASLTSKTALTDGLMMKRQPKKEG